MVEVVSGTDHVRQNTLRFPSGPTPLGTKFKSRPRPETEPKILSTATGALTSRPVGNV